MTAKCASTAVQIDVPRDLLEKIDSLTQTVSSIKTSLSQLKQCMGCTDLSPDDNFPDGWTLAFRGTPNINQSAYDAFMTGAGIPEKVQKGCKQVDSSQPCSTHYRNNEVFNNWKSVLQVAVVLYEKSSVNAYAVFDVQGSDLTNWFTQAKLLRSSWKDLKTSPTNRFSIIGEVDPNKNIVRHFYINRDFGGLP